MDLNEIVSHIETLISQKNLDDYKIHILGKNGLLTQQLKLLGALSIDEKKIKGQELNQIKESILDAFSIKQKVIQTLELNQKLHNETLDITLPSRQLINPGRLHPITGVMREIADYFSKRGFDILEGPEIESEDYNFSKLNIPDHHPARQSHDTFYLDLPKDDVHGRYLLRTHTSNVQIHSMLSSKPPLRLIAMGRTYRADLDATHSPMFHQVECIVVDKHVHIGHLKSTIKEFCENFFGIDNIPFRFRPSFFPFTEPSMEVDIGCIRKPGEALQLSKDGSWLEILGSGMIHPKVLQNCGIDPDEYSGFAFGGGIERLLMLKYGVSDIRLLYGGDHRWLSHYGFSPFECS
jgi:phenylalanyl-tRNA synthetase alpha chain